MLTPQQLATIQAALRYWEEELCPHGALAMRPYFRSTSVKPLTAAQLTQLRKRLNRRSLRFALYDRRSNSLATTRLFTTEKLARKNAVRGVDVATVLISW